MFKQITIKIMSVTIFLLLFSLHSNAQNEIISVNTFNKVIVSPHIEVVFKKGSQETVTVKDISIPLEKLNIDVKNEVLQVYLEGAKITSPTKKEKKNGWKQKVSIYKGTIAKIIITYKEVETFDLRGEEKLVFESPLEQQHCALKIYGESQVYINEVAIDDLRISIYGESLLEIGKGTTGQQKITAYGESSVNVLNVDNDVTRITAYGDGSFQFNVSEKMKITAYGEPTIVYSGTGKLNKGLIIGRATIKKVSR